MRKTKEMERKAYHHGDLPRVLIATAIDLLNERGVDGFSLREVARRAKVAAAAPSHHFGNVTGLLTAVAAEGFQKLSAEFQAVLEKEQHPVEHVVGVCQAYVEHHYNNPGMFSIMFRRELLDHENVELSESRPKSLRLLKDCVRRAISADSSPERVELVAKILWATMHGLVELRLDECKTASSRIEFAVRSILAGSDVSI